MRAKQYTYNKTGRPYYCPIQELPNGTGFIEDKYKTDSEQ